MTSKSNNISFGHNRHRYNIDQSSPSYLSFLSAGNKKSKLQIPSKNKQYSQNFSSGLFFLPGDESDFKQNYDENIHDENVHDELSPRFSMTSPAVSSKPHLTLDHDDIEEKSTGLADRNKVQGDESVHDSCDDLRDYLLEKRFARRRSGSASDFQNDSCDDLRDLLLEKGIKKNLEKNSNFGRCSNEEADLRNILSENGYGDTVVSSDNDDVENMSVLSLATASTCLSDKNEEELMSRRNRLFIELENLDALSSDMSDTNSTIKNLLSSNMSTVSSKCSNSYSKPDNCIKVKSSTPKPALPLSNDENKLSDSTSFPNSLCNPHLLNLPNEDLSCSISPLLASTDDFELLNASTEDSNVFDSESQNNITIVEGRRKYKKLKRKSVQPSDCTSDEDDDQVNLSKRSSCLHQSSGLLKIVEESRKSLQQQGHTTSGNDDLGYGNNTRGDCHGDRSARKRYRSSTQVILDDQVFVKRPNHNGGRDIFLSKSTDIISEQIHTKLNVRNQRLEDVRCEPREFDDFTNTRKPVGDWTKQMHLTEEKLDRNSLDSQKWEPVKYQYQESNESVVCISRSRSRDRFTSRSRSRDRSRSRSKGRFINRNRERFRSRSWSRDRFRSRSSDRFINRSRDRFRSRSRSRDRFRRRSKSTDRFRCRNRSRDRFRSRSKSRDRFRSKSKSRDRYRSRSRDKIRSNSKSRDRFRSRSKNIDRFRSRSMSRNRSQRSKSTERFRSRSISRNRFQGRRSRDNFRRSRSKEEIKSRSRNRFRNNSTRTDSFKSRGDIFSKRNESRDRFRSISRSRNRFSSRSRSRDRLRSTSWNTDIFRSRSRSTDSLRSRSKSRNRFPRSRSRDRCRSKSRDRLRNPSREQIGNRDHDGNSNRYTSQAFREDSRSNCPLKDQNKKRDHYSFDAVHLIDNGITVGKENLDRSRNCDAPRHVDSSRFQDIVHNYHENHTDRSNSSNPHVFSVFEYYHGTKDRSEVQEGNQDDNEICDKREFGVPSIDLSSDYYCVRGEEKVGAVDSRQITGNEMFMKYSGVKRSRALSGCVHSCDSGNNGKGHENQRRRYKSSSAYLYNSRTDGLLKANENIRRECYENEKQTKTMENNFNQVIEGSSDDRNVLARTVKTVTHGGIIQGLEHNVQCDIDSERRKEQHDVERDQRVENCPKSESDTYQNVDTKTNCNGKQRKKKRKRKDRAKNPLQTNETSAKTSITNAIGKPKKKNRQKGKKTFGNNKQGIDNAGKTFGNMFRKWKSKEELDNLLQLTNEFDYNYNYSMDEYESPRSDYLQSLLRKRHIEKVWKLKQQVEREKQVALSVFSGTGSRKRHRSDTSYLSDADMSPTQRARHSSGSSLSSAFSSCGTWQNTDVSMSSSASTCSLSSAVVQVEAKEAEDKKKKRGNRINRKRNTKSLTIKHMPKIDLREEVSLGDNEESTVDTTKDPRLLDGSERAQCISVEPTITVQDDVQVSILAVSSADENYIGEEDYSLYNTALSIDNSIQYGVNVENYGSESRKAITNKNLVILAETQTVSDNDSIPAMDDAQKDLMEEIKQYHQNLEDIQNSEELLNISVHSDQDHKASLDNAAVSGAIDELISNDITQTACNSKETHLTKKVCTEYGAPPQSGFEDRLKEDSIIIIEDDEDEDETLTNRTSNGTEEKPRIVDLININDTERRDLLDLTSTSTLEDGLLINQHDADLSAPKSTDVQISSEETVHTLKSSIDKVEVVNKKFETAELNDNTQDSTSSKDSKNNVIDNTVDSTKKPSSDYITDGANVLCNEDLHYNTQSSLEAANMSAFTSAEYLESQNCTENRMPFTEKHVHVFEVQGKSKLNSTQETETYDETKGHEMSAGMRETCEVPDVFETVEEIIKPYEISASIEIENTKAEEVTLEDTSLVEKANIQSEVPSHFVKLITESIQGKEENDVLEMAGSGSVAVKAINDKVIKEMGESLEAEEVKKPTTIEETGKVTDGFEVMRTTGNVEIGEALAISDDIEKTDVEVDKFKIPEIAEVVDGGKIKDVYNDEIREALTTSDDSEKFETDVEEKSETDVEVDKFKITEIAKVEEGGKIKDDYIAVMRTTSNVENGEALIKGSDDIKICDTDIQLEKFEKANVEGADSTINGKKEEAEIFKEVENEEAEELMNLINVEVRNAEKIISVNVEEIEETLRIENVDSHTYMDKSTTDNGKSIQNVDVDTQLDNVNTEILSDIVQATTATVQAESLGNVIADATPATLPTETRTALKETTQAKAIIATVPAETISFAQTMATAQLETTANVCAEKTTSVSKETRTAVPAEETTATVLAETETFTADTEATTAILLDETTTTTMPAEMTTVPVQAEVSTADTFAETFKTMPTKMRPLLAQAEASTATVFAEVETAIAVILENKAKSNISLDVTSGIVKDTVAMTNVIEKETTVPMQDKPRTNTSQEKNTMECEKTEKERIELITNTVPEKRNTNPVQDETVTGTAKGEITSCTVEGNNTINVEMIQQHFEKENLIELEYGTIDSAEDGKIILHNESVTGTVDTDPRSIVEDFTTSETLEIEENEKSEEFMTTIKMNVEKIKVIDVKDMPIVISESNERTSKCMDVDAKINIEVGNCDLTKNGDLSITEPVNTQNKMDEATMYGSLIDISSDDTSFYTGSEADEQDTMTVTNVNMCFPEQYQPSMPQEREASLQLEENKLNRQQTSNINDEKTVSVCNYSLSDSDLEDEGESFKLEPSNMSINVSVTNLPGLVIPENQNKNKIENLGNITTEQNSGAEELILSEEVSSERHSTSYDISDKNLTYDANSYTGGVYPHKNEMKAKLTKCPEGQSLSSPSPENEDVHCIFPEEQLPNKGIFVNVERNLRKELKKFYLELGPLDCCNNKTTLYGSIGVKDVENLTRNIEAYKEVVVKTEASPNLMLSEEMCRDDITDTEASINQMGNVETCRDDVTETEASPDLMGNIETCRDDVTETEASPDLMGNIETFRDDVTDTEVSPNLMGNVETCRDDITDTKESPNLMGNVETRKDDVTDTEESPDLMVNVEMCKDDITDTEESPDLMLNLETRKDDNTESEYENDSDHSLVSLHLENELKQFYLEIKEIDEESQLQKINEQSLNTGSKENKILNLNAINKEKIPKMSKVSETEEVCHGTSLTIFKTEQMSCGTLANVYNLEKRRDDTSDVCNIKQMPDVTSLDVNSTEHVSDVTSLSVNNTEHGSEVSSLSVNSTEHSCNVTSLNVNSTGHSCDVTSVSVNSTEHESDITSLSVNNTEHWSDVTPLSAKSTEHSCDVTSLNVNNTEQLSEVSSLSVNSTEQLCDVTSLNVNNTGHLHHEASCRVISIEQKPEQALLLTSESESLSNHTSHSPERPHHFSSLNMENTETCFEETRNQGAFIDQSEHEITSCNEQSADLEAAISQFYKEINEIDSFSQASQKKELMVVNRKRGPSDQTLINYSNEQKRGDLVFCSKALEDQIPKNVVTIGEEINDTIQNSSTRGVCEITSLNVFSTKLFDTYTSVNAYSPDQVPDNISLTLSNTGQILDQTSLNISSTEQAYEGMPANVHNPEQVSEQASLDMCSAEQVFENTPVTVDNNEHYADGTTQNVGRTEQRILGIANNVEFTSENLSLNINKINENIEHTGGTDKTCKDQSDYKSSSFTEGSTTLDDAVSQFYREIHVNKIGNSTKKLEVEESVFENNSVVKVSEDQTMENLGLEEKYNIIECEDEVVYSTKQDICHSEQNSNNQQFPQDTNLNAEYIENVEKEQNVDKEQKNLRTSKCYHSEDLNRENHLSTLSYHSQNSDKASRLSSPLFSSQKSDQTMCSSPWPCENQNSEETVCLSLSSSCGQNSTNTLCLPSSSCQKQGSEGTMFSDDTEEVIGEKQITRVKKHTYTCITKEHMDENKNETSESLCNCAVSKHTSSCTGSAVFSNTEHTSSCTRSAVFFNKESFSDHLYCRSITFPETEAALTNKERFQSIVSTPDTGSRSCCSPVLSTFSGFGDDSSSRAECIEIGSKSMYASKPMITSPDGKHDSKRIVPEEMQTLLLQQLDSAEKDFQHDCNVMISVTNFLLSKDPTLKERLEPCLKSCMDDLSHMFTSSFEEYTNYVIAENQSRRKH